MGGSAFKDPRRVRSQNGGGGGTDPTVLSRITYLENNVYKITYFESVNASSGQVTKPTNSTIQLDQFAGGADAYVSTIQNGQPTGIFPQTAGGVAVDVASFDSLGNYTLTGTPNTFPVAIIYILTIKAVDYQNIVKDNELDLEDINAIQRVASTDNAITRFDGINGDIQDSNIYITDNGALVLPPRETQAYLRGLLQYDSSNECMSFYNNESEIFMQIGQEIWMRCRNTTGSTITNRQVVYVNGSSLGLPTIALAQANSILTVVGLTTHSIEDNTIGYVTVIGTVRKSDTSSLSIGPAYLSDTIPGALTNTPPTSPNHIYLIGFVTNVDATNGTIQVVPTIPVLGNGSANTILSMNNAGTLQEFKQYLELSEQSVPSTPINTIRMYADTSNRFSWIGENGFTRTLDGISNTGNRIYDLPDFSGSIIAIDEYYSDSSTVTPGDGSIIYSGTLNNYTAELGNTFRFKSPKNNTVFQVICRAFVRGTLATSELTTVKIQNITQTTEEALTTPLKHDSRINRAVSYSTISNNLDDEMITQLINPNWGTNPTIVHYQWIIKMY